VVTGIVTASLLPERRAVRRHDHDDLQHACMQYLELALPYDAVAHHSPNEGKRSLRAQRELKRSGCRPGWPDIEIIWQGRFYGIELKTPSDVLRKDQRETHRRLHYCGATVVTCKTLECVETSLRELGVPLRGSVA
jgi:hypothetical protein